MFYVPSLYRGINNGTYRYFCYHNSARNGLVSGVFVCVCVCVCVCVKGMGEGGRRARFGGGGGGFNNFLSGSSYVFLV